MKIVKIDIQTSNKKHATDIAMLVDKPEFLKSINNLREKWHITKLYKLRTTPFKELLNLDNVINDSIADYDVGMKRREEFETDIENLLKQFHRGKNFKPVIEYALATGIIPEGAYRSCYLDVVKIGEPDSLENPERDQYVIVLSPRTELKEVKEVYREFREHIKGKIDFQSKADLDIENPEHKDLIEQYHKGNIYKSADIDKFKTLKELDRTREWYWLANGCLLNKQSKKRKTTENILDEWQKGKCPVKTAHKNIDSKLHCPYCSVDDINIIDQALYSYSKLLKIS